MAMPFIIHHNESIYNVIKDEDEETKKISKPIRYPSSKPTKLTGNSADTVKKAPRKTMGYAQVPLELPENYLKINGGVQQNYVEKDHKCFRRVMPPIPKKNDLKKTEIKNFKHENIKNVCSMPPKRSAPKFVDTKNGDFHDLRKSGLMPVFIYQDKFGKLPKYLINRIREAGRLEEMYRDEMAGSNQPLCRYVTQEERSELLGGLKHNWEELQQIYQGLPVLTDTIPKAIRKTKLENQLKQYERDILLVENHPYIYVYDEQ